MFPTGNANADIGFNKHNQFVRQPSHFIPGAASNVAAGPAAALGTPRMPFNMQGGIDWAQLAQQWIHMRDAGAPAQHLANFSMNMPIAAPPPPIISNAPQYQQDLKQTKSHFEEKGEADMDMDEELERVHDVETPPPAPTVTQSQWLAIADGQKPTDNSGNQQWNMWPARVNANVAPPAPIMASLQSNPTAHIPSLLKLNVSNPNEPQQQQQQNNSNNVICTASNTIDANKRKMLPAWIREGLEKMEREKQRQLERQQPTSPTSTDSLQQRPHHEQFNVKQVSSKTLTSPVNLLNISNAASDSEDSTAAADEHLQSGHHHILGNALLSKTRRDNDDYNKDDEEDYKNSDDDNDMENSKVSTAGAAVINNKDNNTTISGKNYEEKLADLMLAVRRTLTEILLETTNEEIAAVAHETIKAQRAKASSAQVIRKSALSSITGNLGLAAYGDSSSESEDEDNENADTQRESSIESGAKDADRTNELSVDELKTRIRRSKRAFEKVIGDIESRVAVQEERDEQRLQHHRKLELEQQAELNIKRRQMTNPEPPSHRAEQKRERDYAETTKATQAADSKLQSFNGKRLSRKERITRFSDNKDGKAQTTSYVNQLQQQQQQQQAALQTNAIPQKLQPVPNPATALLQMPDSVATILSAADKALNKANKSAKKSKSSQRRTRSNTRSSSGDSQSSSSSSSSSDNSSSGSSSKSSADAKKRSKSHRSNRTSQSSSSRRRDEPARSHRDSHRRYKYERHRSDRDRERERDRYESERRRRQRYDSNGSDNGGYHHSSRHSSYGKDRHRHRTRSRSTSRGTHNSSSSTQRRRH